MHIIDSIRFTLSDESDTKYSKDVKIKLINDAMDELTTYIPFQKVATLSNLENSYEFTLPADFDDIFAVTNMYNRITPSNNFGYTFSTLVKDVDYVITQGKLILKSTPGVDIRNSTGALNLQLTYYAKFDYLLEDYILAESGEGTVQVSDASKYKIGDVVIIGEGVDELSLKVTNIDTDLDVLTLAGLTETYAEGTRIIPDLNLDNTDKKITEYTVQMLTSLTGSGSDNIKVKWKTDKMEEETVKRSYAVGDLFTGNTVYGALQKKLKTHIRYKFNRPLLNNFIATL